MLALKQFLERAPFFAVVAATLLSGQPSAPRQEPIRRTLLRQAPVAGMPGWETRTYLIEYGPGVKAPVHHHSVVGLGYVLSGTMLSAFSGETPVEYKTGESFIDPAQQPHTVSQNASASEPLRALIAYTVRVNEPVTITP
jgi:quercetin dioxygenase-like cupin family protein